MLVAMRDFSLNDRVLHPGDEITLAEQRALPARRVEQLKASSLVEEQTDEQAIGALVKREDPLEATVAKLKAPARSRKAKTTQTKAVV